MICWKMEGPVLCPTRLKKVLNCCVFGLSICLRNFYKKIERKYFSRWASINFHDINALPQMKIWFLIETNVFTIYYKGCSRILPVFNKAVHLLQCSLVLLHSGQSHRPPPFPVRRTLHCVCLFTIFPVMRTYFGWKMHAYFPNYCKRGFSLRKFWASHSLYHADLNMWTVM